MRLPLVLNNNGNKKKICIKVHDYNKKYAFRREGNFMKLVRLTSSLYLCTILCI